MHKGIFSLYHIEDIYDFIGEVRIKNKIKELEGVPTLGMTFSSFVSSEFVSCKGVLFYINILLEFFKEDIDICLYIYSSVKKINLDFYNDKLKFLDNPNSSYWIELHFIYIKLLEYFLTKLREKELLNLDLNGDYKIEKNKMICENIVVEIKKRKSPRIGQYLIVKESTLTDITYFNLESKNTENTWFSFIKNEREYELLIQQNECRITILNNFPYTKNELELNNIDFDFNIRELINYYCNNIKNISDSLTDDPLGKINNKFMLLAISYFRNDEIRINELKLLNNNFSLIFNEIKETLGLN